eukprot:11858492-Alexandrium_andersonii.AAC.1
MQRRSTSAPSPASGSPLCPMGVVAWSWPPPPLLACSWAHVFAPLAAARNSLSGHLPETLLPRARQGGTQMGR